MTSPTWADHARYCYLHAKLHTEDWLGEEAAEFLALAELCEPVMHLDDSLEAAP